MAHPRHRVAVIGGGWAGCAAAAELASAGIEVVVYEQGPVLGGRARRVDVRGLPLDNGQHLLVGAYRETLQLLERIHGPGSAVPLERIPLRLEPFGTPARPLRIAAPRLPAPWHLLAALLLARGLSWRDRNALIRDFRTLERSRFVCDPALTLSAAFARTPERAFRALWAPLCLAALNTPPERASAQMFANVLASAFKGDARGSDFLLPRGDLSALLPEPAGRYVTARGGRVITGARVARVETSAAGVEVAASRESGSFDAALIAVAPHQLAHLSVGGAAEAAAQALGRIVDTFAYEPIATVYVAYSSIRCPAIARLDDAPGQWVFDRGTDPADGGRVVGVVISASGPHDGLTHEALAAAVDAQLRRLDPGLGARRWWRVITERRATYACVPNLRRPSAGKIAEKLHLAGDYTDAAFPATLEAAVRSGRVAARSVLAERDAANRDSLQNLKAARRSAR